MSLHGFILAFDGTLVRKDFIVSVYTRGVMLYVHTVTGVNYEVMVIPETVTARDAPGWYVKEMDR